MSTALSNAESVKDNLANDLALAKLDAQEKDEAMGKLRVLLKNEELAVRLPASLVKKEYSKTSFVTFGFPFLLL